MTVAERARRYRDKRRGGPPRIPAECGTRAAAARHRRNNEPLCEACRQAEREYLRAYRNRLRGLG